MRMLVGGTFGEVGKKDKCCTTVSALKDVGMLKMSFSY